MPNMLFIVPPGDGTRSAVEFARAFLGRSFDRDFSAVDVRSADFRLSVIVAEAARGSVSPFRILSVNGADNLPENQQNSLLADMREHVQFCRFILTCESPEFISGVIKEYCAVIDVAGMTKRAT